MRRAAQNRGPAIPADDAETDEGDREDHAEAAPAKPSFFAVRVGAATKP